MDDQTIIAMYWNRDDRALTETSRKYGAFCMAIAKNILHDTGDAEECVNDTWLNAWNAIPPRRPKRLAAFLGRITRNLALNRYKYHQAEKRGGGELQLVLDELAECISGTDTVEHALYQRELGRAINAFVRQLPAEKQAIFVRRYWYAESVGEIAAACGRKPDTVSKILERTRAQFREYLKKRGFIL